MKVNYKSDKLYPNKSNVFICLWVGSIRPKE